MNLCYKIKKAIRNIKGDFKESINSQMHPTSRLANHASVVDSSVDKYTSIGRNTKVNNSKIGRFCAISYDCAIGATSHPYSHLSLHAFAYKKEFGFVDQDKNYNILTTIGNDVWIGTHCIIMPGVTIGDGAVIGAGCVVTKDVLPFSIMAGVPARKIGDRFTPEQISAISDDPWWDWSDEKIKKNINVFKTDFDEIKYRELNGE